MRIIHYSNLSLQCLFKQVTFFLQVSLRGDCSEKYDRSLNKDKRYRLFEKEWNWYVCDIVSLQQASVGEGSVLPFLNFNLPPVIICTRLGKRKKFLKNKRLIIVLRICGLVDWLDELFFSVYRNNNCYQCLVMHEKHYNILQYKESEYCYLLLFYIVSEDYYTQWQVTSKNPFQKNVIFLL